MVRTSGTTPPIPPENNTKTAHHLRKYLAGVGLYSTCTQHVVAVVVATAPAHSRWANHPHGAVARSSTPNEPHPQNHSENQRAL